MALFEQYLYLKKSKLPGAGLGLFTRIDISKGAIIVEYKGRIVKWDTVKHTDGYNGYLFRLNRSHAVDAKNYKSTFGRYANDARGFGKILGLRNNSEYLVDGNKCFITSIRKIYKGEEILVPYGKAYWQLLIDLGLRS